MTVNSQVRLEPFKKRMFPVLTLKSKKDNLKLITSYPFYQARSSFYITRKGICIEYYLLWVIFISLGIVNRS